MSKLSTTAYALFVIFLSAFAATAAVASCDGFTIEPYPGYAGTPNVLYDTGEYYFSYSTNGEPRASGDKVVTHVRRDLQTCEIVSSIDIKISPPAEDEIAL